MEYRFELRQKGATIRSEKKAYSDCESVVEYAVELAVKNGVPDSKVWVMTQDGVVLVLGVRAAKVVGRRPPAFSSRRSDAGAFAINFDA